MSAVKLHQGLPIVAEGVPLSKAKAVMIMIHGRGADPASILILTHHFDTKEFAYLAPTAYQQVWYPDRFLVQKERNEPYLSSALAAVNDVMGQVREAGISPEKTILLGFSQGACLALEYVSRTTRRYGGVAALSGGLIGSDEELIGYVGSLKGTPILLGCSDVDFHIPVDRVHHTAEILTGLGATVDERIYPGMGHTINDDEVKAINQMMARVVQEDIL